MKKIALFCCLLLSCFGGRLEAPNVVVRETIFLPYGVSASAAGGEDVSGLVIMGIVTAVLAGKIVYDRSWHGEYARRVNACYDKMLIHLRNVQAGIQENSKDNPINISFKQEVVQLEQWLDCSYNSWLKPWNWTAKQKELYKKVRIVSALTLYSDLVALGDAVTGADVVRLLRKLFAPICMYPLVYGYQIMIKQLQFISSLQINELNDLVGCQCEQRLSDIENFKNLLMEQDAYNQEVQIARTHQLQEQQVAASSQYRHY